MCCPNIWARRTYVSENALLPGSANAKYGYEDLQLSIQISQQWIQYKKSLSSNLTLQEKSKSDSDWLVSKLESLGLESYSHSFLLPFSSSLPHQEDQTNILSHNVYSVVRAPKSVGTESIVIYTRFNREKDEKMNKNDRTNIGLGLSISIQKYFASHAQKWMAKDIILVLSDESLNAELGLKKWVEDYLGVDNSEEKNEEKRSLATRHGAIQAAIVLDIEPASTLAGFSVSMVGFNGQLPNLDLFNSFVSVCNHEGFYEEEIELTDIPTSARPYFTILVDKISELWMELAPKELKDLVKNPTKEVFGLFGFMLNQAIGVPTGDHGVFNSYRIDSMTVHNVPNGLYNRRHNQLVTGRILEGTVRTLNNLLEKLHQSFYYYLLPSSSRYLAIGDYMIPLGLILAGSTLKVALVLISLKHDKHSAYSSTLR